MSGPDAPWDEAAIPALLRGGKIRQVTAQQNVITHVVAAACDDQQARALQAAVADQAAAKRSGQYVLDSCLRAAITVQLVPLISREDLIPSLSISPILR
jgi:hypothetical protein